MANPIHLDKLCQGPKVWNAWRVANPDVVPDLTDANLTLSQRQFGPSSGGPINLSNAVLEGAVLRYAQLSGADLRGASLAGADLVHARLDRADLTGADLTDAICDHADMDGAVLDDAVLTGASFANARNLTEDQIFLAYGDATTLLPASLMPPHDWFPDIEDGVFPDYSVPERIEDVDLYAVLGVAPSAKPEEIRAAFRNLVKKLHPDLNPGDADAQESFKQVSTAYRILNDTEKRRRYDKGEIGSDGEISPEFEAKRQFRRYAYRFYAAAAMSLLLAVGVLGVVWHAVLTDDPGGRGRVEIAVATPPKSTERLGNEPFAPPAELRVDVAKRAELGLLDSESDAAEAQGDAFTSLAPLTQPERADVPPPAQQEQGQDRQASLQPSEAAQPESGTPDGAADAAAGDEAEQPASPEPIRADREQAETEGASAKPAEPDSGLTETSVPIPNPEAPASPAAGQQLTAVEPEADTPEPQIEAAESGSPEPAAQPELKNTGSGMAGVEASAEPAMVPSPPGTGDPSAGEPAASPQEAKDHARPLGEDHKGEEARPAEADAARTSAPATAGERVEASPQGFANLEAEGRPQGFNSELFMRKSEGRTPRDAISALFRQRAIRQSLASDPSQTTGSMAPLAARQDLATQDEIWDVYTHSIPDAENAPGSAWQQLIVPKTAAKTELRVLRSAVAPQRAAQEQEPERRPSPIAAAPAAAASRKQAVSDVLAGGL